MMAHAYWHWQGRPEEQQHGEPSHHTFAQIVLAPAKFDVRLCAGRDGINFNRLGNRKAFISQGFAGRFLVKDGMVHAQTRFRWAMSYGFIMWAITATMTALSIRQRPRQKTGIDRAILRLDGFVSADAAYTGGEILRP